MFSQFFIIIKSVLGKRLERSVGSLEWLTRPGWLPLFGLSAYCSPPASPPGASICLSRPLTLHPTLPLGWPVTSSQMGAALVENELVEPKAPPVQNAMFTCLQRQLHQQSSPTPTSLLTSVPLSLCTQQIGNKHKLVGNERAKKLKKCPHYFTLSPNLQLPQLLPIIRVSSKIFSK